MKLALIAAIDQNNAIGKDNQLLWHMPADLKFFKNTTLHHTVIMGRKTFESIGKKALPKRRNMVITRQNDYQAGDLTVCHSLNEALSFCQDEDEVFVVGGAQLYEEAIKIADTLYITEIRHSFKKADTFFPEIDQNIWQIETITHQESDEKNRYDYSFLTYTKAQNPAS